MFNRREFLFGASAVAAVLAGTRLTSRERVNRAIHGTDTDRLPFSLWHHFGLESQGPEAHAKATIEFHKKYGTDLVKVMSDFPYPKGTGAWVEQREVASPFPAQLKALESIRLGLGGSAHFVETIFNPWNVAEKLSSKEEVQRLKAEEPQKLLDALEAIAKSEANHAKLALNAGASGIFLAIANAQIGILTADEYKKFSEPFDRIVLDAASGAPLNILHLHGDKVHLDLFWKNWPASINYADQETGTSLKTARAQYSGLLLGGIDQRKYRDLSVTELRKDADRARKEAGKRLILTPGCSVPNESRPEELLRLKEAVTKEA